jgi:hypothetical protein
MPRSKAETRRKNTSTKPLSGSKTASAILGKSGGKFVVDKQPQSKAQAAAQAGMYLYTDDAWSLRYFNDGDLHCLERELFG